MRRVTQCDVGFAGDHCGLVARLGFREGRVNFVGVVAVDLDHVPACRQETRHLVGAVAQRNGAVDGDVVVVPQHDELAQRMATREGDRLLADALHQAAVAGDDIGIVVYQLGAELGALDLFCHGKTDGICDALTQRACRRLNRIREEVFRVARRALAQLAEIFQLLQGELRIAHKVQQRIKQHRAVPCRQDEPVPVGPVGRAGIKLQVLFKQNRCHVCHADGHTRVSRICGRNSVQRQRADGGRFGPVIGVGGSKSGEIHGSRYPLAGRS